MIQQIAYGANQRVEELSEIIDNDFAPDTDKETKDALTQCIKVIEWVTYMEMKRGYHE